MITTVVGQNKILSLGCYSIGMSARASDNFYVGVIGVVGCTPFYLEVMRICTAFRIRRGLPILPTDGLSNDEVERLKFKDTLLKECVRVLWQSCSENSSKCRVTFEVIRDVSYVENLPDFRFRLLLGSPLTDHGSLNAFLNKRGFSGTRARLCVMSEDWLHLCGCSKGMGP